MPLGLANFSLPFCINVRCTLLTVGRIWHMLRTMQAYALSSARNVATIMLESGMLYSLAQLVLLTLYGIMMDHPGEKVTIPMAVRVYVSDVRRFHGEGPAPIDDRFEGRSLITHCHL
ncbi:uncharacterized protein PHACADRAFT_252212, partial [Phanerochaete carnosa HHB-10118-sp]